MIKQSVADLHVSRLTEDEIIAYAMTPDQFLFADEVCSRFDYETTERNVDKFEIALDDRAIALGVL